MKNYNLLNVIDNICETKKIPFEIVVNAIKESFVKTYERQNPNAISKAVFCDKTGVIELYRVYKVVNTVEDASIEIDFNTALKINPKIKIDEELLIAIDSDNFTRTAILQVAQILKQQIREAEKLSIYEEFKDKIGEVMTGKVVIKKENYLLIEIGRTFAFLSTKNMLMNDRYEIDDTITFYVEDVSEKTKNVGQILASRTHKNFLYKLMEQKIPEVFEGIVKIKAVAREPGIRAKVAVYSEDPNIEPIGACVGVYGSRIKVISEQLNGEKIDICKWSENPTDYLSNIFSMVKVIDVQFIKGDETVKDQYNVAIPEDQYSLAIGKKGSTIRLCANLLNAKINVIDYEEFIAQKEKLNPKANSFIEDTSTLVVNDRLHATANLGDNANIKSVEKPITEDREITSQQVIEDKDNKKPIISEPALKPVLEQEIKKDVKLELISDKDKLLFTKYKEEYERLSSRIKELNDKKYNDSKRAQVIKRNYIDLYSYINDYEPKNLPVKIFDEIKKIINLKELKRHCDFIDNFDVKNDLPVVEEKVVTKQSPVISKENAKEIEKELEFYNEIENKEQELDNQYYDNIDYDEYDEYYD